MVRPEAVLCPIVDQEFADDRDRHKQGIPTDTHEDRIPTSEHSSYLNKGTRPQTSTPTAGYGRERLYTYDKTSSHRYQSATT